MIFTTVTTKPQPKIIGSSVKWIDISHKLYKKKLVLCIFVVTKLQEHGYQHNAKRLRRLPTRLSETALRR